MTNPMAIEVDILETMEEMREKLSEGDLQFQVCLYLRPCHGNKARITVWEIGVSCGLEIPSVATGIGQRITHTNLQRAIERVYEQVKSLKKKRRAAIKAEKGTEPVKKKARRAWETPIEAPIPTCPTAD